MGKKSPPAAPDYTAAAQQQGQSSKEVTAMQNYANRPSLNTPWGSQTWDTSPSWDPSSQSWVQQWSSDIKLNPQQQASLDSQQNVQLGRSQLAEGVLGRASGEYGKPMDWSSLPDITPFSFTNAGFDADGLRSKVEDSIYNSNTARLDPQFGDKQSQLETQLANQELKQGDKAWDNSMRDFNFQKNDAYQQARNSAIQGAGEEVSRQGQLGLQTAAQKTQNSLTASNQSATLRQQALAEQMQRRGFSINEINAILNGQQVGMPQMPGFSTASAAQPVQYLDASKSQYQSALDAFNAQQGAFGGLLSGVGSIAKAYYGA